MCVTCKYVGFVAKARALWRKSAEGRESWIEMKNEFAKIMNERRTFGSVAEALGSARKTNSCLLDLSAGFCRYSAQQLW